MQRVSDDERREVAARLRGCTEFAKDDKHYYAACELFGTRIYARTIEGLCLGMNILADLIEPAPERTCRNKVIRNNKEFPPEYRTDNFICSACGAHFFADPEHINHPIDWAFCPDCGAKAVGE